MEGDTVVLNVEEPLTMEVWIRVCEVSGILSAGFCSDAGALRADVAIPRGDVALVIAEKYNIILTSTPVTMTQKKTTPDGLPFFTSSTGLSYKERHYPQCITEAVLNKSLNNLKTSLQKVLEKKGISVHNFSLKTLKLLKH